MKVWVINECLIYHSFDVEIKVICVVDNEDIAKKIVSKKEAEEISDDIYMRKVNAISSRLINKDEYNEHHNDKK